MEKDWALIYESTNETKIEMARQLLENSEIECVVINKKDRSYGFGDYELYCLRENVIRAKMILKEL